jgi:hypothetical protein
MLHDHIIILIDINIYYNAIARQLYTIALAMNRPIYLSPKLLAVQNHLKHTTFCGRQTSSSDHLLYTESFHVRCP